MIDEPPTPLWGPDADAEVCEDWQKISKGEAATRDGISKVPPCVCPQTDGLIGAMTGVGITGRESTAQALCSLTLGPYTMSRHVYSLRSRLWEFCGTPTHTHTQIALPFTIFKCKWNKPQFCPLIGWKYLLLFGEQVGSQECMDSRWPSVINKTRVCCWL